MVAASSTLIRSRRTHIQLINRVDHEVHQVILRHPISQIRRQEQSRVPIDVNISCCHEMSKAFIVPKSDGLLASVGEVQQRYYAMNHEPTVSIADSRFAAPSGGRLVVKRDGRSILRSASVPKPVVLVDTREQQPFALLASHPNWIGGERRMALKTGDYTVEGMEGLLALERKNLPDLVACIVTYRRRFLASCERLAKFEWKAILIEATYEEIKRGWGETDIPSQVHPNAVCGTLDAIEAKFGIPIIYSSTHRELATERAASWLSKHFTYWWLEENGFARVLVDSDKL